MRFPVKNSANHNVIKSFRIAGVAYFWHSLSFVFSMAVMLALVFMLIYADPGALPNEGSGLIDDFVTIIKEVLPPNMVNIFFLVLLGGTAIELLAWIYILCLLRSTRLYTNKEGVWISKGVLWKKINGVEWRNFISASYYGQFSEQFKSYNVKIEHQDSKDNEIKLTNVFNGKDAVEHINAMHQKFVGN
jgi:hypothetical protein